MEKTPHKSHKKSAKKSAKKHTKSVKKRTPKPQPPDNALSLIISHNIDMLTKLSYVDMVNLCRVNKQLSGVCENDNILRSIIAEKDPSIKIPSDVRISKVLRHLYGEIYEILSDNYNLDDLPVWVDTVKFIDTMLNGISKLFLLRFYGMLVDALRELQATFKNPQKWQFNLYDKILSQQGEGMKPVVLIYKPLIATPFHANDVEIPAMDSPAYDDIYAEIMNQITITHRLLKYCNYIVESVDIKNAKEVQRVLSILLFIPV